MIHITWLEPELVDHVGEPVAPEPNTQYRVTDTQVIARPILNQPGHVECQMILTVIEL